MRCPNCQSEVLPGQKFCPECGTRLEAGCSNCGALLPAGAKFCAECGVATGATEGSTAGSAPLDAAAELSREPVAERRLVSVLFADLVGFTTASEVRDAEDTREHLTRYFELARERIERYGGTVEKFIGDAVMAVWGAPVAHEDDAERAVRAALDLVADVARLGTAEAPIRARAAVMTGEAAVTVGAEGQGMVAGDLVNTASRLQSLAEPGTVLVGDATQRAVSAAIAFAPLGDQELRGRTLPVAAWRALRVVAQRGGIGRAEGLEAPFVGRDDELALVKDLYHATTRENRARIVSVTGQAGIGKSRLAWEFLKYLDGLAETLYWHQGRSPAFGDGVSFWALGEMVRGRARILEDEPAPSTTEKLRAMLDEFVPDSEERSRLEPALRSLLGLDDVALERGELFVSWRTLFERVAERGSAAVLVFEDLQWADAGLVDFIEDLASRSRSHAILVITLARPEFLERRPTWGAGQRNFTSIHLEPLSNAAMVALLEGLVPGLPEAARRTILARAEGVPLYAVETVRMLVADGSLERDGDRYRATRPLERLLVPDTLHALVAARLDALDVADRSLLQNASVLGQSFTVPALIAVTGQDEATLRAKLDALVEREWLVVDQDPKSPERGQYQFLQGVVREVAYSTLAKRDRRTRHLAAARYFESLEGGELPSVLASHYLAAYESTTSSAEAEPLAAQARLALRAAADRASSLASPEQALAFLREAMRITDDPSDRAGLEYRAGKVAVDAGRYDEAIIVLEAAAAWNLSAGDASQAAKAITRIGTALVRQGRTREAVERLELGLREAGLDGHEEGFALLTAELARAYMLDWRGDELTIETADRAIAAAEPLDLVGVVAEALISKGTIITRTRPREGTAILMGALALAETHDLVNAQLRAINNVSVFLAGDDPALFQDLARRGLDLARRRLGSVDSQGLFGAAVAVTAFESGRPDEAQRILTELDVEELGPTSRIQIGWSLVYLLAFLGRHDEAERQHARNQATLASISNPEYLASELSVRAEVALLEGAFEDAVTLAQRYGETGVDVHEAGLLAGQAAALLRDVGRARSALSTVDAAPRPGRVNVARRMKLAASVAALEGRTSEAMALYRDALGRLRDLGLQLREASGQLEQASTMPETPEGRAAGLAARETYLRLGATPLVAQCDAALARAPGPGAKEARVDAPSVTEESPVR
jgi:class 3 adenylate cyclase/tetratricopeptide (TPR) repeat protein